MSAASAACSLCACSWLAMVFRTSSSDFHSDFCAASISDTSAAIARENWIGVGQGWGEVRSGTCQQKRAMAVRATCAQDWIAVTRPSVGRLRLVVGIGRPTERGAVPGCAVLGWAGLGCAVLCCAELCYAVLCCAVLCCAGEGAAFTPCFKKRPARWTHGSMCRHIVSRPGIAEKWGVAPSKQEWTPAATSVCLLFVEEISLCLIGAFQFYYGPQHPRRGWEGVRRGGWVGLGWVSACAKGGDPRPVCPYLTGSTGYPPLVVWSHSRPDC